MNLNIMQLMYTNFKGFIKLGELGIIDSEIACDAIIESNDPEYIYEFAKNINNANIERLKDIIIKSNDSVYINYFDHDIKNDLTNLMKLLNIEDYEYILKNKEKFSQLFIDDKSYEKLRKLEKTLNIE